MNLLAYVIAGTGGLVGLLIHILILLLVFALIWWVLTLIPLPPPIAQIVRVIFAVICVIILIVFLLGIAGCATNPVTGKKELDPQIRNSLIEVARGAVQGLAAGAAKTGTLNWQDAAQGALAQVYSVQSTDAINRAVGYSGLSTGYQAALSTAITTVVSTAKNSGLDEKSAILIGTTALDKALQASKAP